MTENLTTRVGPHPARRGPRLDSRPTPPLNVAHAASIHAQAGGRLRGTPGHRPLLQPLPGRAAGARAAAARPARRRAPRVPVQRLRLLRGLAQGHRPPHADPRRPMTAAAVDAPRATRREWIGLLVIALPCMLYSMDLTVLNLALPQISADLKPSSAELLWIVDIYGFLVAGSLITMGTLGDRIGRRRLLLIGATAFGIGSVLDSW